MQVKRIAVNIFIQVLFPEYNLVNNVIRHMLSFLKFQKFLSGDLLNRKKATDLLSALGNISLSGKPDNKGAEYRINPVFSYQFPNVGDCILRFFQGSIAMSLFDLEKLRIKAKILEPETQ